MAKYRVKDNPKRHLADNRLTESYTPPAGLVFERSSGV